MQRLHEEQGTVVHSPHTVSRPWGTYMVVDHGPGFQVKRLMIRPGGAVSLQLHRHRSEHWVVTAGIARVTIGDEDTQLHVGQSVYVPQNTKHRLRNTGDEPLVVVEVQIGAYLEEDDIVRFDDLYGRV